MTDIGQVVDEMLTGIAPLRTYYAMIGGLVWPINPACGFIRPTDRMIVNPNNGMAEKWNFREGLS